MSQNLCDIVNKNTEISDVQRHTPTPASSSSRMLDPKTASTVERILKFGRELHALSIRLKREFGKNDANKKALRVCCFCHFFFFCQDFTGSWFKVPATESVAGTFGVIVGMSSFVFT